MKIIKKIIAILLISLMTTSCEFLEVVPDEKPTERDAFDDINGLKRYLYSCYSFLPMSRLGSGSLDFLTGDEVVTAFEHETFASFPKGNFTPSSPVISYWDTFFQGLRQCHIMLNNVDNVPGVSDAVKKDYRAQVNFLIGYYHFLLVRCYGPVIIINEEPSILTPPSDFLGRTSYEECVKFVCDKFDEAAADLPERRSTNSEYGLATSVAAKALKAKMLLYSASPLFNGNSSFYGNFEDKEGNSLMPLTYDANKWVEAKNALAIAINDAEGAGHRLYMKDDYAGGNIEPLDPMQHRLRYNIIEAGNPEILWADSRNEGSYGLQNKSIPYSSGSAWNGIAPTLTMLQRFYTKNGLPMDEDPEYKDANPYEVVTVGDDNASEAHVGRETLAMNLNREPRYYSWIAFQGGYYEIMNAQSSGAYSKDPDFMVTPGGGKLICSFILGGNTSRGTATDKRTNNYSPTGFLNKKGIDPGFEASTSLKSPRDYPWPIIRLADLYLSYAEACVETNDLTTARTYLNRVRERAGIPTVEDSWQGVAALDQNKLREIVRQERMIELYLENQNFWDMRRWLLASTYFNVRAQGLNIDATNIHDLARVQTVAFERRFNSPSQYLLPIPIGDMNKNEKLVQNPAY